MPPTRTHELKQRIEHLEAERLRGVAAVLRIRARQKITEAQLIETQQREEDERRDAATNPPVGNANTATNFPDEVEHAEGRPILMSSIPENVEQVLRRLVQDVLDGIEPKHLLIEQYRDYLVDFTINPG